MNFESINEALNAQANLLLSQRLYCYSSAFDTMLCAGVGSGKTRALIFRAWLLSWGIPGNHGLIFRDTETNLESSTKHDFFECLPPAAIIKIDKSKGMVRLKTCKPNSYSEITFRHLVGSIPGRKHLAGMNLGWFAGDQMEDCPEEDVEYLATRLRLKAAEKRFRFGIMNSKGKEYNYKRYFKPAMDLGWTRSTTVKGLNGKNVEIKEFWPKEGRYAILGPTEENIHLPLDFVENILANQTREYIERYLYASFEDWAGKIYKDFNIDSPHMIHSFPIPSDWPCAVSVDVGGDAPWAVIVSRIDPFTGDVIVCDELFAPGLVVYEIVSWLKSCSYIPENRPKGDRPRQETRFIIDPANKVAMSEFSEQGVFFEAARKGPKLPGILRVGGYMRRKKNRSYTIPMQPRADGTWRALHVQDAPHIWVFRDRCPNWVREHDEWNWKRIGATQIPSNRPEEKDDHTCDSTIYLLRILPAVEELPKHNAAMDALRRLDPLSYKAAKAIEVMRKGSDFFQENPYGEAFLSEYDPVQEVYERGKEPKMEW